MTDDGRVWPIVVVLCIAIGLLIWGLVALIRMGNLEQQEWADCQTAGYATLARSGHTVLCVGRTGGEWVAVPLADVRDRTEGR